MKNTLKIAVSLLLLFPTDSFCQQETGIVSNKHLTSIVQSNGSLFANRDGQPVNFLEDNNAAHFIRYSGGWMTGVIENTIYANKNCDWETPQLWPGPIDTVTNLPKSAVEWSKVWTITKADVDFHRANFEVSGYTVSEFIDNWPAKHNDNNISAYMAPFIDWNSNGIYDPENGDYPSFEGDYACYFIANDLFGENIFPQANKIGVEIQGLVYAYDRLDLRNTLFVKLFLINRSDNNYAPFYFGQYVDYQLGDSSDNRIETDVARNTVFGFNGDAHDEGGFEQQLPSAGCVFLNHSLFSSTGFMDADTVRKSPTNEIEMLNVMKGLWANGSSKYGMGNGTSGLQSQVTKFIYPNGTDQNLNESWTDLGSGDQPGHRHGLGVVKFNSLNSKTYKRIDLAFVTALSSAQNGEQLKQEIDKAKSFYNQTLTTSNHTALKQERIHPNPFLIGQHQELFVPANKAFLVDATGQQITQLEKVDNSKNKFRIPCSEKVASGVYYLKAVNSNSLSVSKVILINN